MKDKLILTFYIDIRGIDMADTQDYLNTVKHAMTDSFTGKDAEDIMAIFIPVKGESKVECVNPVLVTEQEAIDRFHIAMEELKKLNFKLEEKLINKNGKIEK